MYLNIFRELTNKYKFFFVLSAKNSKNLGSQLVNKENDAPSINIMIMEPN